MSRFSSFGLLHLLSTADGVDDGCPWSETRSNLNIADMTTTIPDTHLGGDGKKTSTSATAFCNSPYDTPLKSLIKGAPKVCTFGTVKEGECTKEIYAHTELSNEESPRPFLTLGLRCSPGNNGDPSCCKVAFSINQVLLNPDDPDGPESIGRGTRITELSKKHFGIGVEQGVGGDVKPVFYNTTAPEWDGEKGLWAPVGEWLRITDAERRKNDEFKGISLWTGKDKGGRLSLVAKLPFQEIGIEQTRPDMITVVPYFTDVWHYRRRTIVYGCQNAGSGMRTPWEKRNGKSVWDVAPASDASDTIHEHSKFYDLKRQKREEPGEGEGRGAAAGPTLRLITLVTFSSL